MGRKGHAAYAEHLYQIIDRSKLTIETPKIHMVHADGDACRFLNNC